MVDTEAPGGEEGAMSADQGQGPSPQEVKRARRERLASECEVTFIRASGPGGQHRNRRETGVRLVHGPSGLVVEATERRSQTQNRSIALDRLHRLLVERKRPTRTRVPTRVPRSVKKRRLEDKRRRATIKAGRRKVTDEA